MRNAIAEIQALGIKVILYTKYIFADYSTDWYRKQLNQYVCKDVYGNDITYHGYPYQTPAQLSNINTRRLGIMCMNSEDWRKIVRCEFEKCIKLGSAGVLYDECFHHSWGRYCFDPNHGHRVPAYNFEGDAKLSEELRKIFVKAVPDFLFAGEALYDLQLRDYHLSYIRIDQSHIPLHRYIDPYAEIMVAVTGFNDRDMINLCLLYRYIVSYEPFNFRGRLSDFPLTIEYGKKVDMLRKRYRQYLWDAEFCDVLGAKVTVGNKPYFLYSVFKQRALGKRAIVVANQDKSMEIEANVTIENPAGELIFVTPENQEPRKTKGTVVIPPRSVIVLMEI